MPQRRTPARNRRLLARAVVVAIIATLWSVAPVRLVQGAPQARLAHLSASRGPQPTPFPLSHVGVRWLGDETATVEVRWRPDRGSWTGWQAVEVAHDLGDEERGVVLSGLLRADGAQHVEARVASGQARNVEVVAIDAVHGPRPWVRAGLPPAGAVDGDARVPQPPTVSRVEWGADESLRRGTPEFAPVSKLAVHHTVTANHDPDPASTVRAIYAYHTQSNGWNDIGYNFLVDAQGRIYEGRYARDYGPDEVRTGEDAAGNGVIGAHAGGNNTGSIGVALLGDFRAVAPTGPAVDSVVRLLAAKADRHDIDPLGSAVWNAPDGGQALLPTIVGHRDVGSTACPGDQLHGMLPAIRQRAADMLTTAYQAVPVPGYFTLARDGRVFPFGDARSHAARPEPIAPAASMATTPSGNGFWLLGENGRILPYGDAGSFGSTEGMRLNAPVVRLEPTRTGRGYWVLAADGGIFSFGDARFHGSTGSLKLNKPIVGMAATPTAGGYWLLGSDGGIFSFGDARFFGSTGSLRLNAAMVSMSPSSKGGYWLVGADGGIFAFGDAPFYGSLPGLRVRTRSVQIRSTPSARGYYILGADGGIFSFGDARFHGSQPGVTAVDLVLAPAA